MASKCCVIALISWPAQIRKPHSTYLGSHSGPAVAEFHSLCKGSEIVIMATGRNLLVSKKFVLEHAAYLIAC